MKSTLEAGGATTPGSWLLFTVLSKGDEALDRHLREFGSTRDCSFVACGIERDGCYDHGDFVLPLSGEGGAGAEVDFVALGPSLRNIRDFLQGLASVAGDERANPAMEPTARHSMLSRRGSSRPLAGCTTIDLNSRTVGIRCTLCIIFEERHE